MFNNTDKGLLERLQPFVLLVVLILAGLSVGMQFIKVYKELPKKSDYLSVDSLKLDICVQALQSIADKKAEPQLIESKIYQGLVESSYEAFPLEIERIAYAGFNANGKCKIVTKDHKGLRGFVIDLVKNPSYPFNYKLSNVEEVKVAQGGEK